MKNSSMVAVSIVIALAVVSLAYYYAAPKQHGEEYHVHADFAVFIDGQQFNFSQEKYMERGEEVVPHMHGLDGDVVHVHARGGTLGAFFAAMDMRFNSTCFVLDDGSQHCNQADKTLKMYVNGSANQMYGAYEPQDLDRILITYGDDDSVIQLQIDSVTDKSCIHSGRCPERGTAPPEDCSTEGGCPIP